MKNAKYVWAGVVVLAMAQAAAAPKVSGRYAFTETGQCMSIVSTTTRNFSLTGGNDTAPAVNSVKMRNSGELSAGVGTITFPATASSSGEAKIEMTSVAGSLLMVNTRSGNMATQSITMRGPFSLTDTTFTFTSAEGATTFAMRPGDIVSGVARTLHMVSRDSADCLATVTATKQ